MTPSNFPLVQRPLDRPVASLTLLFTAWKALLLTFALLSPGDGYDTSTAILFDRSNETAPSIIRVLLHRLAVRLTRWDAIYFVRIAAEDYVHEQEWAFSWGLTRLIPVLVEYCGLNASAINHALVGIAVSQLSHLLSVLVLYDLVLNVSLRPGHVRVAFVAACLHILSPAGMFLSAPYAESLYSFLSFAGHLCYCVSLKGLYLRKQRSPSSDAWILYAGALFGLSVLLRSNGLFSGLLLIYDLVLTAYSGLTSGITTGHVRRAVAAVLAGICTAAGGLLPQVLAYRQYCADSENLRPWCESIPPSIYTNVGFLRYWTLSNAPLFVLASPMLYLLLSTGAYSWRLDRGQEYVTAKEEESIDRTDLRNECFRRLAIPQIFIALLALTNFHVQVINRLSSGYPLWYMVLALWMSSEKPLIKALRQAWLPLAMAIRSMVVYALIQGILFSSFLPPA